MEKSIYDLQSAEWEKTVEMHYLLKNGAQSFDRLIDKGYGVYPEILTLMVSLNHYAEISDVLSIAGKATHQKYDPCALHDWLVAYYEDEWKQKVRFFKLWKIASHYFSSEECAEAELWEALKWKSEIQGFTG